MISPGDYTALDASDMARLVRTGQVSPSELTEVALALIERHNPALNCITQRMDEFARAAAATANTGPFRGVPFVLKDLFENLPGVPSNNGSELFRGYLPPYESTFVRNVREAGLVIVAKGSSPEFGLMPTTEPRAFGPCRNPWNPAHITGGSSGGSAAAVAAGIVPAAAASDGGGSIRIPAACCGLVGLKASRGRYGAGPVEVEGWNGLATQGVVSRTVRDTAALMDVLEGGDPGEPYAAPAKPGLWANEVGRDPGRLRVALSCQADPMAEVHPECRSAQDAAARLLAELGHDVVEAEPDLDHQAFQTAFWTMLEVNTAADLREIAAGFGSEPGPDKLEAWTLGLARRATRLDGPEMMRAFRDLWRMHRPMGAFLARYDIVLTPTLATPPPPIGWLDPNNPDTDELARRIRAFMPFTPMANVFGHPAISLPLHWTAEGLPVGVMFQAAIGREATLLRLAAQIEAARPWAHRHPPIFG